MGLNMYELLPFWHTLFRALGFQVVVSPVTTRKLFLSGEHTIPSDTVCFPAKLLHGHIEALLKENVDAIFYPCMTYNLDEKKGENHFNCPVAVSYTHLYYRAVRQSLCVPEFDAIAHIGIYRRNYPGDYFLLQYAKAQIEDLEDEIALAAARSGKIIEVNTSGLQKPSKTCLPGPFFLERYKHYGGEKLCLSSDAHRCV